MGRWGNDGNYIDHTVELMGSKRRLESANYDQVLNVATGGNTIITITPPMGELWRLKNLYINIPTATGGTAGEHYILIYCGNNAIRNALIYAGSAFSSAIQIRYNIINTANAVNGKVPTTEIAQQANLLNLPVTNANSLKIYYNNGATGGTQNGTISITVDREVETIV